MEPFRYVPDQVKITVWPWMWGSFGMGSGMWFWLLFLFGCGWLIYWRWPRPYRYRYYRRPKESPFEIARMRLARGEITPEAFEKIKDTLEESAGA